MKCDQIRDWVHAPAMTKTCYLSLLLTTLFSFVWTCSLQELTYKACPQFNPRLEFMQVWAASDFMTNNRSFLSSCEPQGFFPVEYFISPHTSWRYFCVGKVFLYLYFPVKCPGLRILVIEVTYPFISYNFRLVRVPFT